MGDSQSTMSNYVPPEFEDSAPPLCALHVGEQRLDLLYALGEMSSTVRSALINNSAPGESLLETDESSNNNLWVCHLRRSIFKNHLLSDTENYQRTEARLKIMCAIFEGAMRQGLEVLVSLKLMRKAGGANYSSIIWKKCIPKESNCVCIDIQGSDRLVFANVPTPLLTELRTVVLESYAPGIKREVNQPYLMEMRLQGEPYHYKKEAGMPKAGGRLVLLSLFEHLASQGYEPYVAANLSDNDSLFFRKSPDWTAQRGDLFLLSVEKSSLLRVTARDEEVFIMVKAALNTHWKKGIMSEGMENGTCVVRLNGSPWKLHRSDPQSIDTKWLLTLMMQDLMLNGWHLKFTFDKSDHGKSLFLFEKGPMDAKPLFCIALVGSWIIRIVNAPRDIVDCIKDVIRNKWYKEVYKEEVLDSCWVIALGGNPWSGNVVPALGLLTQITHMLSTHGWDVIASARTSGIYESGNERTAGQKHKYHHAEVDSIWFAHGNQSSSAQSESHAPPDYDFA